MKRSFHKVIGKICILVVQDVEIDIVSENGNDHKGIIDFVIDNVKEGDVVNYELKVVDIIPNHHFCNKTIQ